MSALDNTLSIIQEIEAEAQAILGVVSAAAPGIAGQIAVGEKVMELVTGLVGKALSAYEAASGVAITADSINALRPNPTPLTPPDAPAQ